MKTTELTDDYLSFAEDELKAGNLTAEALARIQLQVAAEYLIQYDNEEKCLITLNKVPVYYFKDFLSRDMKEDSFFAASMAELAYHLERRGITWHGVIKTTQSTGEA